MAKTIYDVAREAGVAVSTVSRAMNNSGYVSARTREKIRQAMDGYQPNAAAQHLVTKVSRTIAVVSAMTPQYFFIESGYAKSLAGIVQYANENDYRITLDIGGEGSRCISLFKKKLIDGMILIDAGAEDKLLKQALSEGVPVVLLGSPHETLPGLTWVDIDRIGGVCDATNYLIALGHRRIALLNGSRKRMPSVNKQAGFEKAMREAGIPLLPEHIAECEETDVVQSSYRHAKAMLERPGRPTAIFAYADIAAMGVYQAAGELNLRIPEDLSVIGFDNSERSQVCTPGLTSVAQPIYEKGFLSARYLAEQLQGKHSSLGESRSIILPCYPVLRDSCARPGPLPRGGA